MDLIIHTIKEVCKKFILCETGYANHELARLTQLLLNDQNILKEAKIFTILERITQAQECKNNLYIADLLEYELLPALTNAQY